MQVFADDKSSEHPIEFPKAWISNLQKKSLYCGMTITTIFRGEETYYCWSFTEIQFGIYLTIFYFSIVVSLIRCNRRGDSKLLYERYKAT